MKTGFIALHTTTRIHFVNGRRVSSSRGLIYYRIQRQVMIEYRPQFRQATGWQRRWLKWRIAFEVESRYRNLV